MRACGRCGHVNADPLVYCFSCGRRLAGGAGLTAFPGDQLATPGGAIPITSGSASDPGASVPDGLAATVALPNAEGGPASGAAARTHPGLVPAALDSLRYVFAYVRGRIDAEDRRRRLIDEREGARRLVEGAFAELGQMARAGAAGSPPLAGLVEAIARAEARRETAVADLAAAEKFEAAEDLRLGNEQAAAEAEWRACDLGAADVDTTLRRIDEERRQADAEISRLDSDPSPAGAVSPVRQAARAAQVEKRAALNHRYGALRERASALRASTVATRTRLDQAVAARRQAAVAMVASLAGHARERNDADAQIRDLVTQLGRAAAEMHPAPPDLAPSAARVDRLQQIIADHDRQIAGLERTAHRSDIRKLATGLALLAAILGMVGASLWALLQ